MKRKKDLGQLLKERRMALGLTQRALGEQLGVKPSHVAYIEGGRRRPSLALLERIAVALGLDRQELFLLAHPEAKKMVSLPAETLPKPPRLGNAWREFVGNRALLARYRVTPRELKALKQLSLLGYVLTPREFLAILSLVRTTASEES